MSLWMYGYPVTDSHQRTSTEALAQTLIQPAIHPSKILILGPSAYPHGLGIGLGIALSLVPSLSLALYLTQCGCTLAEDLTVGQSTTTQGTKGTGYYADHLTASPYYTGY